MPQRPAPQTYPGPTWNTNHNSGFVANTAGDFHSAPNSREQPIVQICILGADIMDSRNHRTWFCKGAPAAAKPERWGFIPLFDSALCHRLFEGISAHCFLLVQRRRLGRPRTGLRSQGLRWHVIIIGCPHKMHQQVEAQFTKNLSGEFQMHNLPECAMSAHISYEASLYLSFCSSILHGSGRIRARQVL